jgi:hypothetical protein
MLRVVSVTHSGHTRDNMGNEMMDIHDFDAGKLIKKLVEFLVLQRYERLQ